MSSISLGAGTGIPKSLLALENSLDALKQKASEKIPLRMFDSLEQEAQSVKKEVDSISETLVELAALSDEQKIDLLPKEFKKKIDEGRKAVAAFDEAAQKAQKSNAKLITTKK
jgi:hypothetical protein